MLFSLPILIFAGIVGVNILYYAIFTRFSFGSTAVVPQERYPISLLVYTKNQAEFLESAVHQFLQQDYFKFEIVLINNVSSDNSLEIIERLAEKNSHVRYVNVEHNEAFWGNRKYALTLGIKKASYPHILIVNLETQPDTPNWISEMASHFSEEKKIIIGYTGQRKHKLSLVNKFIRFMDAWYAIKFFSMARWGIPYTAMDTNLAFVQSVFYEQSGYASHMKIRYGDGAIFVSEAATSKNTAIAITPGSRIRNRLPKPFSVWVAEQRKYKTIKSRLKKTPRLILSLFTLSQWLFWLSMGIIWLFELEWPLVVSLIAVRFIWVWLILSKGIAKVKEQDVIWFLPIFEIMSLFFSAGLAISNRISKPKF